MPRITPNKFYNSAYFLTICPGSAGLVCDEWILKEMLRFI